MSNHPVNKETRNLRTRRNSLFDNFEHPGIGLPWDDELRHWVEREQHRMSHDLDHMRHHFLDLEPFKDMEVNTKRLADEMGQIVSAEFNPEIVPEHPLELNFLKNAYEAGKNGLLYFKTYFNAHDFAPENIKVTTEKNKLTIHASKTHNQGDGSVTESFGRSIALPDSVDRHNLKAYLTSDGILITEAPVIKPNYKAIKIHPDKGLVTHPLTGDEHKQLALTNKKGLDIVDAGEGKKKMHLELSLEHEFTPGDVIVWTDANKVFVSGKKEETVEEKGEHGEFFKSRDQHQFQKAYIVPGVVDASAMVAEMNNGHLVVEAPLTQL